jgi:hypothetical protein
MPALHIHLCYFHVGQAIQRWITGNGLQAYYNKDESSLKVYVGLVRALGFLPINDVINGYQLLRESDHYQQIRIRGEEQHLMNNINALHTYLTRNYINDINIPQWNVHELNDHRTNNDMEGYHHRLRERFTNRITNFWGFMLFMLNESCIMHAILTRMRGGEVMQGRRKVYRRNEERILQLKVNYENDHDILVFLNNVRLCINN